MSAPVVSAVFPAPDSTDAVLRTKVWVEFSTEVDPRSVNANTFAVLAPEETVLVNPSQALDPRNRPGGSRPLSGRIVQESPTRFAFIPSEPLRPQARYRCLLVGGSGLPGTQAIRSPEGTALAKSYQWSFVTGTLDLEQPPLQSPVNLIVNPASPALADWLRPQLDPELIQIIPVPHSDGTQIGSLPFVFDIQFPGPVDPAYAAQGIGVWLEPPANAGFASLPDDLEAVAAINGDTLRITIQRRTSSAP